MIPRATYRLQFHAGFTFADAKALVPYLDRLGVSHIYASPITVPRPGSSHGYDVVDPTRVNPVLGGEDGLADLVDALKAHGMGMIIDIVPNHMGVSDQNTWWMDVLANGPTSRYAHFFDIFWSRGDGRMVLPFLGDPLDQTLEAGDIALETDSTSGAVSVVVYGDTRYPLRPETIPAPEELNAYDPGSAEGRAALATLLERQHYRLAWWRQGHDILNWRRFFSVSELAGLRVEEPEVFETTHALYFRLYSEGLIEGVRIDHVDGLADPTGYLDTLRARFDALEGARGGRAYIIVEKILEGDEVMPPSWPVEGTSGYDFMALVSGVLHAPEAEPIFTRAWSEISGRSAHFAPEEVLARTQMLAWEFSGQRNHCVDVFAELAAKDRARAHYTKAMIGRAIDALLVVFPVYRTYGTGTDALPADAAIRADARARALLHAAPGEIAVIDWILSCLAGEQGQAAAQAVQRFQQLSSPIAAKSVEDTAFYRYGRLLSRNDVGFDAATFALTPEQFHRAMRQRVETFPHSMLATATHDHKRGEDVRTRIAALSHAPETWLTFFADFEAALGTRAQALDRGDFYMLAQLLYGVWPDAAQRAATDWPLLAERMRGWQEKAIREAKLHSTWVAPDLEYEARLFDVIDFLCGETSEAADQLTRFSDAMAPITARLERIQTVIKFTVPGVPDIYQGTELEDFSLVDPDNRRAVDFARREATVENAPDARPHLIAALLEMRRADPVLFRDGTYTPIDIGPGKLAYAVHHAHRGLICVCALDGAPLPERIDLDDDLLASVGHRQILLENHDAIAGLEQLWSHGVVVAPLRP